MDFLKKLTGMFKKLYEKVLLAVALAAVAVAGFMLNQQKQNEEEEMKKYILDIAKRKPKMYQATDWSVYLAALQKSSNAVSLDFSVPRLHNLVNPVKWQRRPDGSLLKIEKGNEVGVHALKVTKISPLLTTISMDKSGGGSGYFFTVQKEASTNAALRKKVQSYVTVNGKDRAPSNFILKEIKSDGSEVVVELLETGEKITIQKDKPYQKVEGYMADFSYPPENQTINGKRQDDTIRLGGEDYNIVAIAPNEVVFSGANKKRTTLRYNAP